MIDTVIVLFVINVRHITMLYTSLHRVECLIEIRACRSVNVRL